jgi:hypothetical protein
LHGKQRYVSLVPSRRREFQLTVDPQGSRRAAKRALTELGWEFELDGERLATKEDPVRLCCSASPVEATIGFQASLEGTLVDLEVSVPGFGPPAQRQLADRAAGLEQRITRWALGDPSDGPGRSRTSDLRIMS